MANFYHRFLESVQQWPEGIAVEVQPQDPSHGRERYSFAALRRLSDSAARRLADLRLPPRAHCALLAKNQPRWVAAFLGTLAAGHVVVPLDTALNPSQVRKLLEASDSTILIVDGDHRAIAEQAAAGLVPVVKLEELAAADTAGESEFVPLEVDSGQVAAILYSSGTTGDPKGVMLTHDNFLAETGGILEVFDLGPRDTLLGVLPLFHAFALAINLLLPMAAGMRIIFLESLNTADLLRALPSASLFACVPQFFYLLHERIWKEVKTRGRIATAAFRLLMVLSRAGRRLGLNPGKLFFGKIHRLIGPNMRYLGTGGSRFDPEIGHDFEALGFTMLQGYGLTETTGAAMHTPPKAIDIASLGRPLPGLELKIVDPKPLEDRPGISAGEIALRGRMVMKGYYKRPDATAEVLKDGWLYTGDLGYVGANGDLILTGRAKEIIVLSSGKNVYPEEIEAHYLKSPLIKEVCVLGIASQPGEPVAERLHGVIVPNFEELRARNVVNSQEALRFELENLSVSLPSTKRILSYELWQDDLPRTTTRKVKRFEVERRVLARIAVGGPGGTGEQTSGCALTEADREWLAQPDVQRALAVIQTLAKNQKPEIHPADNLELDLGLDSMERVELLVAVERELGTVVEDSVVAEVYTVRELVDRIRSSVGKDSGASAPAWEEILRQEPTLPEVLALSRHTPLTTAFWFLACRTAYLLARDLFHLRVQGLEKLPAEGPFILSPNHQSYLDAPVLVSCLPWKVFRRLFYVGTSEIFGQGVWRTIARSLKLVPVDPDANLLPAMQAAAYGLRRGKALVLYPEGERSADGTPKVFKKGAAILALHLNVPIYPVALDGFYEAWPRKQRFQKFTRARIVIGDPIQPPPNTANPERAYEALTETLRSRVTEMWNQLHAELYQEQSGASPVPETHG